MNNQPIVRSKYENPFQGDIPLPDPPTVHQLTVDQEQYVSNLEQAEGVLRDPGVGAGLTVTATLTKPGLTVATGIALDLNGRHISLAAGGFAEVNPNANATSTLVQVTPGGVAYDTTTAGGAGSYYLTIAWRETFNSALATSAQPFFEMQHTPWLQLQSTATFTPDGISIVLAELTLDAQGNVTAFAQGPRVQVGLPIGTVRFLQSTSAPTETTQTVIDMVQVGSIGPDSAGGLAVSANGIIFQSNPPAPTAPTNLVTINTSSSGAGQVQVLTRAGNAAVVLDTSGMTDTGLVRVRANNQDVIVLNAGTGSVSTIGPLTAGSIATGGNITGGSIATNGTITGGNIATAGTLTGGNISTNGTLSAGEIRTTGNVGIGTSSPGFLLDVANRMRVRQGSSGDAGIWLFQTSSNTDHAFVGMDGDTQVGFWGSGIGWGLTMGVADGSVTVNSSALLGMSVTGHACALQANSASNTQISVILATAVGPYAGIFNGNVQVSGTLSKTAGTFLIDHPQDPANKYLRHAFVESPDMMNIYTGIATTDDDGQAIVELPAYFGALNTDIRYQLTPIGQLALVAVIQEAQENRFTIKSDKPHVQVSWMVTGVRQDAYANANRVVVEEDKKDFEKGNFIHPELFGAPDAKHVWMAHARQGVRDRKRAATQGEQP